MDFDVVQVTMDLFEPGLCGSPRIFSELDIGLVGVVIDQGIKETPRWKRKRFDKFVKAEKKAGVFVEFKVRKWDRISKRHRKILFDAHIPFGDQ